MTAGPAEDQAAAQAMAAGEAAHIKHMADALAQHAISGSTVAVEDAATPDDVAVVWPPGTPDTSAQPTLIPSEPRPAA